MLSKVGANCQRLNRRACGPNVVIKLEIGMPRDLSDCTREQLEKQIHLLEMSNAGLQAKLKKVTRISNDRLKRMKNRSKLLMEARSVIVDLQQMK